MSLVTFSFLFIGTILLGFFCCLYVIIDEITSKRRQIKLTEIQRMECVIEHWVELNRRYPDNDTIKNQLEKQKEKLRKLRK